MRIKLYNVCTAPGSYYYDLFIQPEAILHLEMMGLTPAGPRDQKLAVNAASLHNLCNG